MTKTLRCPHLCLFPILQCLAFTIAVARWPDHPLGAIVALVGAALALSFSVHIAFHELVHVSARSDGRGWLPASLLATLWMGLPFDRYRWHHDMHHRHDNSLEDYSCTWQVVEGVKLPRHPAWYSLFWPFQLMRGRDDFSRQLEVGKAPLWIHERIQYEKALLIFWFVMLMAWNPVVLLGYLLMMYAGWALISLHNYGQHLPTKPETMATSFQNVWYNRFFCNNGIHFEHHCLPEIPCHELKSRADAPLKIHLPHLVNPLFFSTLERSRA
jgi:fatty acid desaturase